MNKNVKILGITASGIDFNDMELDAVLKRPIQVDLLVQMVRELALSTVTTHGFLLTSPKYDLTCVPILIVNNDIINEENGSDRKGII